MIAFRLILKPQIKAGEMMVVSMLLQNLAMRLPTLAAGAAALVMISMFRLRAATAAKIAMWCVMVKLLIVVFGAVLYAYVPKIIEEFGIETFQLAHIWISLALELIYAVALVGLVYAVFQGRLSDSDKLPELDEA